MNDSRRVDAPLGDAMTQTAALCFRVTKKQGCQILLITSRDTGRWVIPKGWPMKGRSDAEAAKQEAFEEAGAEGKLVGGIVGLYSYDKVLDDGSLQPCIVSVHAFAVRRLHQDFPERKERTRRWFNPEKAAKKVEEPELKAILAGFDPKQFRVSSKGSS